jgi:hypothetical protein
MNRSIIRQGPLVKIERLGTSGVASIHTGTCQQAK